jgi:hypothetical protein
LPIALAILIPAFAVLAILLIHKGFLPARSWALVVLGQALLLSSGWLALETGEDQEERVERVVAERHIEAHEEAAERFLVAAGIGLLASTAGLLPARAGALGRVVGALAAFAVLSAGVAVGHSGGELVYKHGAASAYFDARAGESTARTPRDSDND